MGLLDPGGIGLLAVLFFVSGIVVGRRAPLAGFAAFLCFLGVTSSAPWQLGYANLTPSLTYLIGLALGTGTAASRPTELRDLARVTLLVMTISAAVGIALSLPPLGTMSAERFVHLAADLVRFDPDGLSAATRAALVATLGPALFAAALAALASRAAQARMQSLVTLSLAGAIAGVAIQFAWLDPFVRPDLDRFDGDFATGVVGLFQDPHSFAAYLVLTTSLVVGIALAKRSEGDTFMFLAHASLGLIAGGVLLATQSRSGLVAAVVAALTFVAMLGARRSSQRLGRRARLVPYLATGPIILAIVAALLVLTPLRAIPRGLLAGMGQHRASALFDDARAPLELAEDRLTGWSTAVVLIRDHPLWGVGPRGFVTADVEQSDYPAFAPGSAQRRHAAAPAGAVRRQQAHNYFLQLGAEYGLPTLVCFLWLVGSTLRVTATAAASDDDAARSMVLSGIVAGEAGFLGQCLVSHPLLIAEMQGFFWFVAALGAAMAASTHPAPGSADRGAQDTAC